MQYPQISVSYTYKYVLLIINMLHFVTDIDLPQGSIMDYGPQSICVPSSSTNVANCVAHRCVQIQGTELLAFSLSVNGNNL